MPYREVETDNPMFKDTPGYAIKIKENLGTAVDGLFITEDSPDGNGLQIKFFPTLTHATEVAESFNAGAVDIIKYVYRND